MKLPISAVILTKNEEDDIANAIRSVKFCSEIIIIDDYSTDKTLQIAKQFDAKVYKHKLNNNFAAQRNFALKRVKYDWVLYIDADERVPRELARSIEKAVDTDKYAGYYLNRQDSFMGKTMNHGEWGNIVLLRLAKKNAGAWKRKVHEYWQVKGEIGELEGVLEHYPHTNLSEFVGSISRRAGVHAAELSAEGKSNFTIFRLLTNPVGKFLRNMFIYRGIVDGAHGFVFATLLSFQSFISWSQLWLNTHKKQSNT